MRGALRPKLAPWLRPETRPRRVVPVHVLETTRHGYDARQVGVLRSRPHRDIEQFVHHAILLRGCSSNLLRGLRHRSHSDAKDLVLKYSGAHPIGSGRPSSRCEDPR